MEEEINFVDRQPILQIYDEEEQEFNPHSELFLQYDQYQNKNGQDQNEIDQKQIEYDQNQKENYQKQNENNQNCLENKGIQSQNNSKDQNSKNINIKDQQQSTKQIQNFGLVVSKIQQQEKGQNSSLQSNQQDNAQYNLEAIIIEVGNYEKVDEQIRIIYEKIENIEESNKATQKSYPNIKRILKRKSQWKQISKQAPNIVIDILFKLAIHLRIQEQEDLYDLLEAILEEKSSDWDSLVNLKSLIKQQGNEKDFDSQWMAKKKSTEKICYLKSLKTLLKMVGIKKQFKENESFSEVLKELDISSEQLKVDQKQEQITQLKNIVCQIQEQKKNQKMKKTLNFNQSDILVLCRFKKIKKLIHKIYILVQKSTINFISDQNNITQDDLNHIENLLKKICK